MKQHASHRPRRQHLTDNDEDVRGRPPPKRRRRKAKEEEEDAATIHCLPPEMLLHLISFLTLPDLVTLGQTCCWFHEVCECEAAWRHFCKHLPFATASTRPCKRAAILNYTKGLYVQSLGCRRQREPRLRKLSSPCHGYRKLVPARQHLFALDYCGTLFFLRNPGRRGCCWQTVSHSLKDVTVDSQRDISEVYVLTGQEQCDILEVYRPADAQHILHINLPPSIRFRQLVVTKMEARLTILLLTEAGQLYKLRRDLVHLAPEPISFCQPVCTMVTGCGGVAFLTETGEVFWQARTSRHQATPTPITMPLPIKVVACSVGYNHLGLVDDQGRVYMRGRNRYGQLGTGDRLDRTEVTQVRCPPCPRFIWCDLNCSLLLTSDRSLLGCGRGANDRLPGWPDGSVNFVRLHVEVPPWVSSLSVFRDHLFFRCGHDIEEPRLYQRAQPG